MDVDRWNDDPSSKDQSNDRKEDCGTSWTSVAATEKISWFE